MKCTKGLEIKVMKSYAGYYIGTEIFDKEMDCEVPNCRISVEYFKTKEKAEKAMTNGFMQRNCMENDFCSAGRGCGISFNNHAPQSIGAMMVKKMIEQCEKGR